MKEQEVQLVKLRAAEETKYKVEAMTKLEALRQEMQTFQGNEAQTNSVAFWKEQCQNLFDICKNLKEDNEKLVDHIGTTNDYKTSLDDVPLMDSIDRSMEMHNYLNASTGQAPGYATSVNFNSYSKRNNSQQQAVKGRNNTYELAYGMNQSLQEHMLKGHKHNSRGGLSSVNSLASEHKDIMVNSFGGGDLARVQLPKIGIGRNIHKNQQAQESVVMNGAVGTGRFSIGQQSPFVNKVGNDQESMNTVKLTPKYERQMQQRQQFMQGNNMFASLTGGNSIISTAKTNIFQQAPGDTFNSKANHSLDMTTNITGNISTQREQSPGQVQHSVEMP